MQKFIQYLKDVRSELGKVSWPTRNEVTSATVLVLVLSIALSLFVYICDMVLNRILGFILQINL